MTTVLLTIVVAALLYHLTILVLTNDEVKGSALCLIGETTGCFASAVGVWNSIGDTRICIAWGLSTLCFFILLVASIMNVVKSSKNKPVKVISVETKKKEEPKKVVTEIEKHYDFKVEEKPEEVEPVEKQENPVNKG